MRLFRTAGSSRTPWRKGCWVFPLWDKGALQLWGAASARRVRGQGWICATQSLPWRAGSNPRGHGQDLQEVWAQLTATRNKPLRNLSLQCLERDCTKEGDRLSNGTCCNRTRSSGFKLKEGWFRLHIRKKLFAVWGLNHWNVLPREVVDELSLARSGYSGLWQPGLVDVHLGR